MADRGDTHYHIPNMNRWFLFSSLFFTATIVWTVIDDWNAEWKTYQREFRALDLQKAEAALEELESSGALETEAELLAKVAEVEERLSDKRDEIAELEKAAYAAFEKADARDTVYKKSSEDLKYMIFNAEKVVEKSPPGTAIEDIEEEMGIVEARAENAELQYEVTLLKTAHAEAVEAVAMARKDLTEVEKELTVGTRDLAAVREKVESLDPSDPAVVLANIIRDAPAVDFIGPKLQVQKTVLDGIELELNFTTKPVIDMCTTCHMGMERVGFEEEEQPYSTHPRLDLFLSSKSPHPTNEMGCTVCHRGSGESLGFQHADHRPSDDAEAAAWYDEYHWHKQHHWDYPMLKTDMVEASCIQCHKDSMELIAEDAPKVSEGYQLVEQHGCYACHKVDWFPTKRRPGPSLLAMTSKLTPEWTESWINDPRGFRPTTWMPQVFHLENYAADEPVVTSNYEQGREIMGEEWNRNAVSAITAYLYDNHAEMSLPALPTVGNAERGREVMNIVGCFACHNTAPWDGEESKLGNNSDVVGRYNDKGPNLRGVQTKLNAEWLYHWLKNPADYWPDTRMPNLRLSDQDAADITAYMMEDPDGIFGDTPDDWTVAQSSMDLEVLQEQARWFFGKMGRTQLDAAFAGEDPANPWTTAEALAPEVGKAMVSHYGCFSCHEIGGMLDMMPIGAELSQWGTKTVDKLDFGQSYLRELTLPASLLGEEKTLPKLSKYYREGWLERKLHHPRSFDIDKVKNPKEKLRMPWFDFTDEEVEAIATFIVGLVDDNVPGAKMEPTPEQLSMNEGMRHIRQKNCIACHVVEPASITFEHENGQLVTAVGEFMPFEEEPAPPKAYSLDELMAAKAKWEEWTEEEMEELTFRLWSEDADIGEGGENIQIPIEKIVSVEPPLGGDYVKHVTDYYQFGVFVENPDHDPNDEESYPTNPWTVFYDEDNGVDKIEDVDGELRAYGAEEYSKVRWTFAPPVLVNEGYKVQSDWFYSFLMEPFGLRQQMRVKMPSFHYEEGAAQDIADYFLAKARKDWEPTYARRARLALGRELEDGKGAPMWNAEQKDQWPVTTHVTKTGPGMSADVMTSRMADDGKSLSAAKIHDIEDGYAPEVAASFAKIHEWAEAQGFEMGAEPMFGYEQIKRQAPSYLAVHGDRIPLGKAVAEDGVNCYQCHPKADGSFQQDPIAWAPALEHVRERLREDYTRDWLWNPSAIYPGTAMPQNFAADVPQYQEQYANSDNAMQVEAVLDWLYNMSGAPRAQPLASAPNMGLMTEAQLEAQLAKLRSKDEQEAANAAQQAADEEAAQQAADEAANAPEEAPVEEPAEEQDQEPAVVSAPVTGAGIVSGRVVFDGAAPTLKPLIIKDAQSEGCCAPGKAVDDTDRSLLVGAGNGVQNVVVTIEVDGAEPQEKPSTVVLDQIECRYEPRVVVLPVGSSIEYKNSDSISHNIHTYATKNEGKNFTLAAGTSSTQELEKEETFASGCDIHPWMKGYVVVTEATHWATTAADGSFTIQGLPPGDYKVSFWHETLGKSKGEVTVPESGAADPMQVEMKAGGGGGGRRRR